MRPAVGEATGIRDRPVPEEQARDERWTRSSVLSGQKIAVIGATGFIGARLVETLARGHRAAVSAVVRDTRRASRLDNDRVSVVRADLGDRRSIRAALQGHDVVVNTAHDFRASERSNVRAFSNLVDACAQAGVRRLVHTSSIVVYDDWPGGQITEASRRSADGAAYKNAKIAMEEIAFARSGRDGPTVALVQPSIVYGPHGWMWTDRIVDQLRTGTLVLPNRCDGNCPAVYVDDVAEALARAADVDLEATESFIVSGPGPVSWRRFFESYARMLGSDGLLFADLDAPDGHARGEQRTSAAWLRNPLLIAQTAPARALLGLARKAIGEPALERVRSAAMTLNRRRGPILYSPSVDEIRLYRAQGTCSTAKAERVLGHVPAHTFEQGMALTAAYVRERYAVRPTGD